MKEGSEGPFQGCDRRLKGEGSESVQDVDVCDCNDHRVCRHRSKGRDIEARQKDVSEEWEEGREDEGERGGLCSRRSS